MDAAQRRIDAAGVDEDFASEMRRAVSDEPDSTTLLRQVVANQQEILRRLAVHESHLAKIAGTLDDLVGPAPEPADAEITVAPAPEGASDSDGDADPEAPEAPLAEEASDEPPQAS